MEHKKHNAIKELLITEDEFIVEADTKDEELIEAIRHMISKMQQTLDQCREAVLVHTDYVITQKKISLKILS